MLSKWVGRYPPAWEALDFAPLKRVGKGKGGNGIPRKKQALPVSQQKSQLPGFFLFKTPSASQDSDTGGGEYKNPTASILRAA